MRTLGMIRSLTSGADAGAGVGARWRRVRAKRRSNAQFSAPAPLRTWHSSSRQTLLRTQFRPFSTSRWPRVGAAKTGARAGRERIEERLSVVVLSGRIRVASTLAITVSAHHLKPRLRRGG